MCDQLNIIHQEIIAPYSHEHRDVVVPGITTLNTMMLLYQVYQP